MRPSNVSYWIQALRISCLAFALLLMKHLCVVSSVGCGPVPVWTVMLLGHEECQQVLLHLCTSIAAAHV